MLDTLFECSISLNIFIMIHIKKNILDLKIDISNLKPYPTKYTNKISIFCIRIYELK